MRDAAGINIAEVGGGALSDAEARGQRMFRSDLVRGGARGVMEACWQTFALLVLIRVFGADEAVKRHIPAALGYGLILTPFVLVWVGRWRLQCSSYVAILWGGIAVCFVAAALVPQLYVFLGAMMVSQVLAAQGAPILTHLYSQNYRPGERGRRLSTAILLTSILGIGFGFAGGYILDLSPETLATFPILFLLAAGAAVVGALALSRMPAQPLNTLSTGRIGSNVATSWRDRVFRWLLIAWMLLGLGNLMLVPLRVELLANEAYGFNASNTQVALIMAVVIPAFRLLSTYWWGIVFDRFNLINVRIALNLCFLASIALFFFTSSLWVMAIGAAMQGVAMGGGGVMWTLWVTKVAPPGKVSVYMSVHGFFTGLRASVAPFLGYLLLESIGPRSAALVAMGLIIVASLLFLPLRPVLERYRSGEFRTG